MNLQHQLDAIDKEIIKSLSDNARRSFTEIASKLGVAAGTIHVRVSKLEDAGVIEKTTLKINWETLGFNSTAFIALDCMNGVEEIKKKIKAMPNVISIHVISGEYNLFCKVIAQNNFKLTEVLSAIKAIKGINRSNVTVSLGEVLNDENSMLSEA